MVKMFKIIYVGFKELGVRWDGGQSVEDFILKMSEGSYVNFLYSKNYV